MTPKEKAKELFENYSIILKAIGLTTSPLNKTAKRCALIAVDEILEENSIRDVENDEIIGYEPYWLKVKQEIGKL